MTLRETMKIDNSLLLESGIRIPKGTRAAKIIFHEDLDGIMSAILVVNQLEKQGIPRDKIKLSGIQYGDNNEEVKKKLSSSKGQMVVLVDFARIPEGEKGKLDFWSDHHVNEDINEMTKKERDLVIKGQTIYNPKYPKPLKYWFEGGEARHRGMEGDIRNLKTLGLQGDTPEERVRAKKAVTQLNPFLSGHMHLKPSKRPSNDMFLSILAAQEQAKTKSEIKAERKRLAGTQRDRSPYSKSGASIGRTDFSSETGHLARTNARGIADKNTIDAIDKVDSASYSSLEDIYFIRKDFAEKGRMERLANITNILLGQMIKGNPNAVNNIIKVTKPSLVSLYMNVLKAAKLSEEQVAAIQELSKDKPDMEKVNAIRAKLSPEEAKDVKKGSKINAPSSLEGMQDKAESDLEKHTDASTTKFMAGGPAVIIQNASGRGQPSRFLGSLLTKKDGSRYPAQMREWATMMQISLNPELSKTKREQIDLVKVINQAMDEVKKEMEGRWNNWSFKIMKKESGGHKAIATVSAIGTIGFLPKEYKPEFKELSDLEARVKKVGKNFTEMMPRKAERLKELKKIKDDHADERREIKKAIKDRILTITNKELEGVKVKATKSAERFKGRSAQKESIMWRVKHWI